MIHRQRNALMLTLFGLFILLISLLIAIPAAQANPAGVTDQHGGLGTSCNDCHREGQTPIVRVSGVTEVQPSQAVMYMLAITSTAPLLQTHAGWNIAVLDDAFANVGTLAPINGDSSNQSVQDQLIHSAPLANDNGTALVAFNWTAPATPGTYTLFFAGNSVDNNWQIDDEDGAAGDAAALGALTITVSNNTQVTVVQRATQVAGTGYLWVALVLLSATAYLIWQQKMGKQTSSIR